VQNFTAGFQPHTQRPLIKRFVWALDHFSLKRLRQRARYRKAKSTVKRKKSKSAEQDKPPQKKKRAGSFSLSGRIGTLSGRIGTLSGWIGS
jgi:hypothetical protein